MKKNRWIAVLAVMVMALAAFGCKTDIETEWKDKTYCSAVTFASEATADGVKVTMATTTAGAVIYYTTDGTLPTEKSTKYSKAIEFTKDATVKAIAIKEGIENSPVSVATVSIKEKTIIADETAPKDVKNFAVVNKDAAALLTWKDPTDRDLFGIEVTYCKSTSSRAISVMEKESIFVAPGTENAVITGLTNGTLYTFTVKAMDLSGNKSAGVIKTLTPSIIEKSPLQITLTPDVAAKTSGNAELLTALNKCTNAIINNKEKIDYNRMGTEMGKAVAKQSNPIIMDKTLVGRKVAEDVDKVNKYRSDQQSRFRGDKDYV